MKLYGSINNRIEETTKSPIPEVGMGVTEMLFSDRSPYTIVEILSPKRIAVTHDTFKRIDHNGMSECQEYEYTSNMDAPRIILRQNKDGQRKRVRDPNGSTYVLGRRERYYDHTL